MDIISDVVNSMRVGKIIADTLTNFPSYNCQRGILLKADKNNAGTINLGRSDLNTNGFPLDKSETLFIPINDPSKINILNAVAGDIVYYMML